MSKKRRIYNKRIIRQRLVLFIMTGILALLIGRIAYLKVVKGEEYEGIAKTQDVYKRQEKYSAVRDRLFFMTA